MPTSKLTSAIATSQSSVSPLPLPGSTNHSSAVGTAIATTVAINHGFRRPLRSAIAPNTGLNTAITSAASPCMMPHWVVANVTSPTTAC